jgi:hypothetical protein
MKILSIIKSKTRSGVSLLIAFFLIFFATANSSVAHADQLTLTAQVNGVDLLPEVSGLKLSCWLLLTNNFDPNTWKPYGPYPYTSAGSALRMPNGKASGTLSVVVTNWIPEAKYYHCSLIAEAGGTTGFMLPTDQGYSSAQVYRRAKSGVLHLTGTVP